MSYMTPLERTLSEALSRLGESPVSWKLAMLRCLPWLVVVPSWGLRGADLGYRLGVGACITVSLSTATSAAPISVGEAWLTLLMELPAVVSALLFFEVIRVLGRTLARTLEGFSIPGPSSLAPNLQRVIGALGMLLFLSGAGLNATLLTARQGLIESSARLVLLPARIVVGISMAFEVAVPLLQAYLMVVTLLIGAQLVLLKESAATTLWRLREPMLLLGISFLLEPVLHPLLTLSM